MGKTTFWIVRTLLLEPDQYVCSECRAVAKEPFRFCPGCGAEMTGRKKDLNWIDEAEQIDASFF